MNAQPTSRYLARLRWAAQHPGCRRAKRAPKLYGPCEYCGDALDAEEAEFPRRDESRSVMCDDCWRTHYEDYCSRCDECVDKEELASKPGSLIVVYDEVPACGQEPLTPGYYRVLAWPFFADGMVEGYFFGRALRRVGDLCASDCDGAKDRGYPSGGACAACQTEIEAMLVEAMVMP